MARSRGGFTLIELIVVIGICTILLGLLLAGVQRVRAAAERAGCGNNLRQMGIALHHYHDVHNSFPPGNSGFFGSGSNPLRSLGWQAFLLPYIEQDPLWRATVSAFRESPRPFNNPPHVGLGTPMAAYVCPSDSRTLSDAFPGIGPVGLTHYLGVAGTDYEKKDGILYGVSRVRIRDILDGTGNTLMVGERPPSTGGAFLGWWYAGVGEDLSGSVDMILGVYDVNLDNIPNSPLEDCPRGPYKFEQGTSGDPCDVFHFWSRHPGGANFLFADGSVHFLSYSAESVIIALATRAGGESVDLP